MCNYRFFYTLLLLSHVELLTVGSKSIWQRHYYRRWRVFRVESRKTKFLFQRQFAGKSAFLAVFWCFRRAIYRSTSLLSLRRIRRQQQGRMVVLSSRLFIRRRIFPRFRQNRFRRLKRFSSILKHQPSPMFSPCVIYIRFFISFCLIVFWF